MPERANDDLDTVEFTPPEHLPLLLPAKQLFLRQHVRATHMLKETVEEIKTKLDTKLDETNASLAEKQQWSDKIPDEPHEFNAARATDYLAWIKSPQQRAEALKAQLEAPLRRNLCWSRSML